MALETVLFVEGVLKISNLVLAVVAGVIALTMFAESTRQHLLRPWRVLTYAIILFGVQMLIGALRAFKIYESPFLTHIVPGLVLVLLIRALILQQNLNWVRAK